MILYVSKFYNLCNFEKLIETKEEDNEQQEKRSQNKLLLCMLFLGFFFTGLVVSVAGLLVLDIFDNEDDSVDDEAVVVDFTTAEFNLIEYLAIWHDSIVDGELDLRTFYGGHMLNCIKVVGIFSVSSIQCPTLVNGGCVCDQGSINQINLDPFDPAFLFSCDIDVNEAEEQLIRDRSINDTDESFDDINFSQCDLDGDEDINFQQVLDNSAFFEAIKNVGASV